MKKAQILSAIALAFALGVVAPVAGVNAIDPRAEVTTPAPTATADELNVVIKSIEAQPEYKAYVALKNAVATTATDTTLNGLQADIETKLETVLGGDYEGETTLAATIAAAKNTENYAKWAALVAATTDNSTSTSADQKVAAIQNAATALNLKVTLGEGEGLAELQAAVKDNADYKKYQPLVAAVEDAEEKQASVNTAIANLKSALAGVNVDARDIATAAETANPITSLKALAPDATTGRAKAYNDLIAAVEDAKTAVETNTEEENATAISNLKADYKAAAGADLVVVDTPTDPTTPGEDGDDTTTDPSAPGTGVLSSADGNAATTVSIVAGLATALTALGAGVVAYRSARRSSEK